MEIQSKIEISELRKQIAIISKIPEEISRMTYSGKELLDPKALSNHSTIEIKLRLKGGMQTNFSTENQNTTDT